MRVVILATGKTEEHNDSYAARLIEQGRAVLAPPAKPSAKKSAERKE